MTTAEEMDVAAPASEEEPAPRPDVRRRAWIEAAKWVVLTRLVFGFVAFVSARYLATDVGQPVEGFSAMWSHWDARLFFLVAEHGYTDAATDPHSTAFFPLFPLLLKVLHGIGFDYTIAGVIISAAASWVALAYLYRWAEEELGADAGRHAVAYLAFFPTAVFLIAPYSEALFLAGAIPAFYYARRRDWHLAGAPAAIATASRSAGLFLLAGMGFEFVRQKQWSLGTILTAAGALATGLVPLLFYGVYLARVKGDFFYYLTDQKLGWGRDIATGPLDSFSITWNTYAGNYAPNWIMAWRVEVLAAAIGLAAVVWALAKAEWGYAAFMGTFLAVLVSSGIYYSIPRMLVSFFPIMLLLAGATRGREQRHAFVLLPMAMLAATGTVVFTQHAWFH